MAKKSPEMQLFLLQQAANAAKEAERAERIALAKRKMDLEEEKVRLRAARVAALEADTARKAGVKLRPRKLTVAETEDARIAELTRLYLIDHPELAPIPAPTASLNPEPRDLDVDAVVMKQAQHAADIEAARKAWNEKQHEEWLAAQQPESSTPPKPPKPPKPPEADAGDGDDTEPTP